MCLLQCLCPQSQLAPRLRYLAMVIIWKVKETLGVEVMGDWAIPEPGTMGEI